MKYIIPLIPPSLNAFAGRQNTWEYRKLKDDWKQIINVYCRPRPTKAIHKAAVTITYHFKDNIRRDPDNYCGKMLLDGLTACNIIEDDDFFHLELSVRRGENSKKPFTEIEVAELQPLL